MNSALALSDKIVLSSYLLLLFGVGVYFARQKRSLKTYLLADQNVHWIVVGVSILAALFSGITYMGAPAETFFYDLRYVWVIVAFFIATPITTLVFLPYFRNLKLYTAYEYLDRRFDYRLRRLASMLFILRVVSYLGLAIYAPALAIMEVAGWPFWLSVTVTGMAATIYTAVGGMSAVIWTDTVQFVVLCGGIIVILCFAIAHVPGGLPAAWHFASMDSKTKFFDFSFDPSVRITVWGALIGGTCYNLVQMVTDQIAVQRYLTAPSLKDAQRALWLKFWVTLPLIGLFYLTGTVLYGYYRAFPDRAPRFINAQLVPMISQSNAHGDPVLNDRLLPYFVTHELPSPLPGLLIAAILGATIAVVSAGINALATAALLDFRSKGAATQTDQRQVTWARILTVVFGVIPTLLALFVMEHLGSLVSAIITIGGLFGGPLLGIFFLGAFTKRANANGALIGALLGSCVGVAVAFPQYFLGRPISFLWIAFASSAVTFISGLLTSLLFKSQPTNLEPTPELVQSVGE